MVGQRRGCWRKWRKEPVREASWRRERIRGWRGRAKRVLAGWRRGKELRWEASLGWRVAVRLGGEPLRWRIV